MRGSVGAWVASSVLGRRLLLVLLLVVPVLANASAQVILRTAAQMGSDPKYIDQPADHARIVSGLCIDIHRAIEHIDPSIRIVGDQNWEPAARIEHLLEDGRLDMACALVRTPERERSLRFVEPRVAAFHYKLAARTGDAIEVRGWDDVRKLEPDNLILANHGWGYVHQLDAIPGLRIDMSAYSPDVNLQKLAAGHGRFFYFREPGLTEAIRRVGLAGQVRILPAVMSDSDVFMALRATLPPSTIAIVQHAMSQLDSSGELARLAGRWN